MRSFLDLSKLKRIDTAINAGEQGGCFLTAVEAFAVHQELVTECQDLEEAWKLTGAACQSRRFIDQNTVEFAGLRVCKKILIAWT